MTEKTPLLDTRLCPACAAPWVGVSEVDGIGPEDDQCSECGFETSVPVPMRNLLCLDLPDGTDDSDWKDLATFARLVAQATLESPDEVRRLLEKSR
jgi:hypothetical protein